MSSLAPPPLEPRYIDLPYLSPSRRLAYLASYYAVALPAILRPHRLILPERRESYRAQFALTRAEQRAWFDLFGLDHATGERVPFTYATTAATRTFMQLLGKLGVNFKHVRHVASEMDFLTPNPALAPEQRYTYTATLEDIFAVGRGRIVLELSSSIFDEAARLCARHTDFFMVTGFRERQLTCLRGERDPHKVARFAKVSAYRGRLEGQARRVSVHPQLGTRYGQLSGDMNLVHTTTVAARLMGFPKAFIQGFCTLNLILSRLAQRPGVKHLNCTLTRPVFVGEEVDLYADGEHFELRNGRGKVLAYGTIL